MSKKFQSDIHLFNYVKKMLTTHGISLDNEQLISMNKTCSFIYSTYEQLSRNKVLSDGVYVKDILKDFIYSISNFLNEDNYRGLNSFVRKFIEQLDLFVNYISLSSGEENIDFDFIHEHFIKINEPTVIYGKHYSDYFIQDFNKYGLYQCGIYFLYDDSDKLIYIGKSKNLFSRVASSIKERKATKYRYALLESDADMNIYEVYYISLHRPSLNSDCRPQKNPSVNLPELQFCELKTIFKDIGIKQNII